MPLLAVNLPDKLFDEIKALIDEDKYKNFDRFLEVAAFNQLALERGATPSEIVARDHRNRAPLVEEKIREGEHQERRRDRTPTRKKGAGRIARQVFVLDEVPSDKDDASVLEPFALCPADNGPSPCEPEGPTLELIFGQVNRLLPLKIACRWIAARAFGPSEKAEWPVYALVSDTLGDDAAKLGSVLEKWDAAAGRKRDDQLATGLPRRGNSASRDRFLSQFLARVTRSGETYPGAICQYQLARFLDGRLALTHHGVAFAQLKNPVLDSGNQCATENLGQDEAEFLTKQILDWVHGECDDMRAVLSAVVNGKVRPGDLVQSVKTRFPPQWTESMALTHISGLVARLADLRLLRRRWQGRNVEYELGEHRRVDAFLRP